MGLNARTAYGAAPTRSRVYYTIILLLCVPETTAWRCTVPVCACCMLWCDTLRVTASLGRTTVYYGAAHLFCRMPHTTKLRGS